MNVRVVVGVVIEFDADTYRDRDTMYAQIRTTFEKLPNFVEKKYGVRMEAEVRDLEVRE